VRYKRATRYVLLIALALLAPSLLTNLVPRAHAVTYSLGTIPFLTQEGSTITLVFSVSGATGNTLYQFRFSVRDPASITHQSVLQNYTTLPGQTQFTLPPFYYPTSSFPGPNSLVGQYVTWADQVRPLLASNPVAATYFLIILTDNTEYQRTQTINIHATGYGPSEQVNVKIATYTTSTTVFTQTLAASGTGVVVANWKIPRNATIDNNGYVLTINGTSTIKTPADIQGFNVRPAVMSISTLGSAKSIYQRTETMSFSFQPVYPDGTIASNGVALLTLARPDGMNLTLTTTYSSASQTFNATYKTTPYNQTGTWTTSLARGGYADSYGNSGPLASRNSTAQLVSATFTISMSATTYVPIGQPVKFNATISYPDGTRLQSGGSVFSYLVFSGSPPVNDTVPVIFDSGLNLWVGTYSRQATDPGGLWSLELRVGDSATPPNSGSATRAITIQDNLPVASFTYSPSTALTGVSISFDGTASYDPDGTIVTYSWAFGDGTLGSGSNPSHMYNLAGIFNVTLTVTDNSASTAPFSNQITIIDRQPTVTFSTSTTSQATGQPVTVTITASDPDGTISGTIVDWGDGSIDSVSGTTDSHSYTLTGAASSKTFTITVTVTDNSGQSASYTRDETIQATSSQGGVLSLPLYYFGILAAIIATLVAGGFFAFRRHRVTHARLKIDLEAVRSEAGRIENQDFFQSVKDQLKKDKDDQ